MKARSAAPRAATEQGHSHEPGLLDTLAALPAFLLILPLAGLPFARAAQAARRGRVMGAIGLSLISVVILTGCYLVIGGWWAAINEKRSPNYSPPGEQYVAIAVALYASAALIGLVIFSLYVWIARRHPFEQSMEPHPGPPRGSTRIVRSCAAWRYPLV